MLINVVLSGIILLAVFCFGVLAGIILSAVRLTSLEQQAGAAGWNAYEGICAFVGYAMQRESDAPPQTPSDISQLVTLITVFVYQHQLPAPREGFEEYLKVPSPQHAVAPFIPSGVIPVVE